VIKNANKTFVKTWLRSHFSANARISTMAGMMSRNARYYCHILLLQGQQVNAMKGK